MSLSDSRPRPTNVASDATEVINSKTHWWVKCVSDDGFDKCKIYNAAGEMLANDVYLPYDGGPASKGKDLRLDPTFSTPPYVLCLMNGRSLIWRADFAHQKQFITDVLRAGGRVCPGAER